MKLNKKLIILTLTLITMIYADIPAGYYNDAEGKTGSDLKSALYNIIKGHTEYPYTSSGTDVWDILKQTDKDTSNSSNVILLYSGLSVNAAQEYNNGAGWTREHVWAKSRGDFGTAPGAGTDVHHLRPENTSTNSARNNRWFANGGIEYNSTGNYYSDANWTWEPRDEVKGDVARMIFYMATRYEGENGEPDLEVIDYLPSNDFTTSPIHALLSDLLEWHNQDPVNHWERNRNDIIYTNYQHNRNPFIDHPEYVALIWTDNPPPVAPSNLEATDITQTSLSLTWNDNTADEDGFYIFQDSELIGSVQSDSTSYDIDELTAGTTYSFGVASFNENGQSSTVSIEATTISDDTVEVNTANIFFSEYIEGSSNNKALEIYNADTLAIPMNNFAIRSCNNGGDWNALYEFPDGTILKPDSVFVLANSSADAAILAIADEAIDGSASGYVVGFNGNDARQLIHISGTDTTVIDVIGAYGENPGDGWAVAGIADATENHTLIRKDSMTTGTNNWTVSAGTNTADSEWEVMNADYFDGLGKHSSSVSIICCDTELKTFQFKLLSNYPNPFNPSTTIPFQIGQKGNYKLTVYNLNGQLVQTLVNSHYSPGNYQAVWNGKTDRGQSVTSGIYFYTLESENGSRSQGKMILLK